MLIPLAIFIHFHSKSFTRVSQRNADGRSRNADIQWMSWCQWFYSVLTRLIVNTSKHLQRFCWSPVNKNSSRLWQTTSCCSHLCLQSRKV